MKFDFNEELDNCIDHLSNLITRNTYPEIADKILMLKNKVTIYKNIYKSLTEYKALKEIEEIKTYRSQYVHINAEIMEDVDYKPVWQILQHIKMSLMMHCANPNTTIGKRIIGNSMKMSDYLKMVS